MFSARWNAQGRPARFRAGRTTLQKDGTGYAGEGKE